MRRNKKEVKEKINCFFKNVKNKKPEEVKKIKRLAMHHSIKLGKLRKKFCKYCYSTKLKVRGIKNKTKTVQCRECGKIMRWRVISRN